MVAWRDPLNPLIGALFALLALVAFDAAWAQSESQEIALTDTQVENFIKAQADLAAVAPKLQDAGDEPAAAVQDELEQIAKKHGFADFAELDNVAANISMVMSGLDNDSGTYVDPVESLKDELNEIKADSEIPEADKKQLISELEEAIATSTPLKFPGNIEVVKKHQDALEKALE